MAIKLAVNQEIFLIENRSSAIDDSLLSFLRSISYTGPKKVCAEGGCGACSVVMSVWNQESKRITHQSIAACLMPLPLANQTHITTIEGLSKLTSESIHPICDAFYQQGASQCGFCTPGIIMALLARLSKKRPLYKSKLEQVLDGNICRCTGYRPILDAAAIFCNDPLQSSKLKGKTESWRQKFNSCTSLDDSFPSELKKISKTQFFRGKKSSWLQAVKVGDVLSQLTRDPQATLVGGNTDLGYTKNIGPEHSRNYISLNCIQEMQSVESSPNGIHIGACIKIEQLKLALKKYIRSLDSHKTVGLKALLAQCRFLGNSQIRSQATVGGGIINFSHYSDLVPIWVACDARLRFKDLDGERDLRIVDFYNNNNFLDWEPRKEGLLVSIFLPFTQEHTLVSNFKYSRRRLDSITFLSAGSTCQFDGENKTIKNLVLCFNGLGAAGLRALETERHLTGKVWDQKLLVSALACLKEELARHTCNPLPARLQNYQVRLGMGVLIRTHRLFQSQAYGSEHGFSDREERLTDRYPEVAHRSKLHYPEHNVGVLGQAIPHRNAKDQTTGRATYTTDIQSVNCLYACIVTSPKACGKIKSIDPSKVILHPEVLGFYTAEDIPGKNIFGFRNEDEEVLASRRVHYVGQPVGVLVARSYQSARQYAQIVDVQIEEEDPILSMEQAIEAKSIHGRSDGYLVCQGSLKHGFENSKVVVAGSVEIPGQSHFYLEPQSALAIPKEDTFEIYSSTQSPSNVVEHVSRLLGIHKNRVDVRVGRLGGGFGGKQLRAGPIAAICALAAHKVGSPVKLCLDRQQDMSFCPGRSPAMAEYRAGFDGFGRVQAVEIDFCLRGGYAQDYSADITEAATLLMDSVYKVENVKVRGRCLKTNYGANTATRGFGKPQASAIIETIIDHGACELGIDPTRVRELNLYKKGDLTITKTVVRDDVMQSCWHRLSEKAQYSNVRRDVDEFNRKNKWVKRGVAVTGSKGNMGFIESDDINRGLALVHIMLDGTVSVNHSGIEMGQGLNTRMAQVAASCFDVPLGNVLVTDTQSALIPNTPPTTMTATDLIGKAIVDACAKLNRILANYPGSFQARVEQAYENGDSLSATGVHSAPRLAYDYKKQEGDISYFFVWGAAISIVEVDVISGSFRLLDSKVVQDCGKSLNPHLDIGQAEGGFVFGLGYYCMEEMIYSDKGRLITDNVSGYKLPSCGDVPLSWDIELLNYQPTHSGIHNSKGIGESNVQLGLSVYFAIKDAVLAARKEAGLSANFHIGFPASVDRVSHCLPELSGFL